MHVGLSSRLQTPEHDSQLFYSLSQPLVVNYLHTIHFFPHNFLLYNICESFTCATDFTAHALRSRGNPAVAQEPSTGADSPSFIAALTSTGGRLGVTDTFIMMDWRRRHGRRWLLLNGSERVLMAPPPGCQPPHTQAHCESKDCS